MFARKLTALNFPNRDAFDVNDKNKLRELIIWLEGNKLRLHSPGNREGFAATTPAGWDQAHAAYLKYAGCPFDRSRKNESLDWLLAQAVRNDYMDNAEEYSKISVAQSSLETEDPLGEIQYDSAQFVEGINRLAALLNIQPHPDDPSVTLRAVAKYAEAYLSTKARQSAPNEGTPMELSQVNLGFDLKHSGVNEAAKVLRLLFIDDIRDLQTRINEAIVAVQTLTADPRTDTRLAQVGRGK